MDGGGIPHVFKSLFVVVTQHGRQILTRCEGEKVLICHEFKTTWRAYETCDQYRKEISSYFNITDRIHILLVETLENVTENCSYVMKVVEVIDKDTADVAAPFSWLDWPSSAPDFNSLCPHPHISHFLTSYLSSEDFEELNLSSTPWRRLGFSATLAVHVRELASRANLEIKGELEQIHFGSHSTVYKVSTNEGALFAKVGTQGMRESRNTRLITTMFPDHTPNMLGSNDDLELMLSEDHGPSLLQLYFAVEPIMRLNENEIKMVYRAVLSQWAQVQRESMGCTDELLDSGIPLYDEHWIREAFEELKTYMRKTALDKEIAEIFRFDSYMEQVFVLWERVPIPNCLVHGDLHEGNVGQPRGYGTRFVFFDWDSAFVGHPFLDLLSSDSSVMGNEVEEYLEHWKDYGDIGSLREIVFWTKPLRFVIEAVNEIARKVWTTEERRWYVQTQLEDLVEVWKACEAKNVLNDDIPGESEPDRVVSHKVKQCP